MWYIYVEFKVICCFCRCVCLCLTSTYWGLICSIDADTQNEFYSAHFYWLKSETCFYWSVLFDSVASFFEVCSSFSPDISVLVFHWFVVTVTDRFALLWATWVEFSHVSFLHERGGVRRFLVCNSGENCQEMPSFKLANLSLLPGNFLHPEANNPVLSPDIPNLSSLWSFYTVGDDKKTDGNLADKRQPKVRGCYITQWLKELQVRCKWPIYLPALLFLSLTQYLTCTCSVLITLPFYLHSTFETWRMPL